MRHSPSYLIFFLLWLSFKPQAFSQSWRADLDSAEMIAVLLGKDQVFLDGILYQECPTNMRVSEIASVSFQKNAAHLWSEEGYFHRLLQGGWSGGDKTTYLECVFAEGNFFGVYFDRSTMNHLYEQQYYYAIVKDSLFFYSDAQRENFKFSFYIDRLNDEFLKVSSKLVNDRMYTRMPVYDMNWSANIGHQFLYQEGRLQCGDSPDYSDDCAECLRLGDDLVIGLSKASLRSYLAEVAYKETSPDKWVISDGRNRVVLFLENDRLKRIKWIGFASRSSLNFSGISLGDMDLYVEEKFGKPIRVEVDPQNPEKEWWYYGPYPFRLQLLSDRVHVIEINGLDTPLHY
ncbi:hypothetical protein PEDI_13390 [Persicobacter diffluens]|uniref:Uncharacterized protein n=2 Tax=Persicobacter diffluens TaxID=981 RepID=A0AAN4VWM7_9BACT|nr:hypothetical protein PEDI_13390 [Persicobacter diffluens]